MDITKIKRQLDAARRIAMPKTAIVWGGENLLAKAIESLLNAVNDWQVVKVFDNHDVNTLAREVEKIHPEVVFISLEGSDASLPVLPQDAQDIPGLKVITINPANNRIEVFSRQVFWIENMTDLLSVIEEQSSPVPKGGKAIN